MTGKAARLREEDRPGGLFAHLATLHLDHVDICESRPRRTPWSASSSPTG